MSTSDTRVRTTPASEPGIRRADDLYGWVQQQMTLLQAGQVDKVDASELLQELAEMGRGEFAKLVTAIRLVLHHLLKWDHQPERRSRSWAVTIRQQRREIADELLGSPSLKPRILDAVRRAYVRAIDDASRETGLPESVFPEDCPYDWEAITRRPVVWEEDELH
jgi:hypothetical protein